MVLCCPQKGKGKLSIKFYKKLRYPLPPPGAFEDSWSSRGGQFSLSRTGKVATPPSLEGLKLVLVLLDCCTSSMLKT